MCSYRGSFFKHLAAPGSLHKPPQPSPPCISALHQPAQLCIMYNLVIAKSELFSTGIMQYQLSRHPLPVMGIRYWSQVCDIGFRVCSTGYRFPVPAPGIRYWLWEFFFISSGYPVPAPGIRYRSGYPVPLRSGYPLTAPGI